MNTGRLLRLSIVAVLFGTTLAACDKQGATVGPYPSTTMTPTGGGATPTATPTGSGATPTATPTGSGATPTATPTGGGATPTATPTNGGATPTATPTASGATPTPTPTATGTPGTMLGALVISPDPLNFGVLSVLGATMTANISQSGYNGPFTLPANPVVCGGGLLNIPVTATISGSTLSVSLGALGVTGACTITVDGAPGTSGTETVNLAVPLTTPPNSGPFVFTPNPVVFNVVAAVLGSTATTTVTEVGYTGTFSLPANAISCPFNLLPLTQLAATINGNVITLTTGTLNANLLGSCNVTVDDTMGHSGQFAVNFQIL